MKILSKDTLPTNDIPSQGKLPSKLALLFIALASASYCVSGYSFPFLLMWLTGLAFLSFHYWQRRDRKTEVTPWLDRDDLPILFGITIMAAWIYLPLTYYLPIQGNTDELVIFENIRRMMDEMPQLNPLGPSKYFGFPVLIHLVFGWLASALGGCDFGHLRFVHALSGACCVIFSYVFFRSLGTERLIATGATALIGLNHTLMVVSRMLSRNNTTLLVEVISLSVLFRGFLKQCPFLMYLGGILAGLSFYTYTPARTIFFNFLLAVGLIALLGRSKRPLSYHWNLLVPALIAFCITIAPMMWSTMTGIQDGYPARQFLFTQGGREEEQGQESAKSEQEAVMINIRHGLMAFNAPLPDSQSIYWHPGFGIVDTITGAMIWIGLIGLILLRKKRAAMFEADVLCASAFVSLWLLYSFVVNLAPNYMRLLTIFPFVGYLAANGMKFTGEALVKPISLANDMLVKAQVIRGEILSRFLLNQFPVLIFVSLVLGANFLNAFICYGFMADGFAFGDVATPTFRIIDHESANPSKVFLLAADDNYHYYVWGDPSDWKKWLGDYFWPGRVKIVKPADLKHAFELGRQERETTLARPPFRIFMDKKLWDTVQPVFQKTYPNAVTSNITSEGDRITIDVKESSSSL